MSSFFPVAMNFFDSGLSNVVRAWSNFLKFLNFLCLESVFQILPVLVLWWLDIFRSDCPSWPWFDLYDSCISFNSVRFTYIWQLFWPDRYTFLHLPVSSAEPLFYSRAFYICQWSRPVMPSVAISMSQRTTVKSKEVPQGPSGLLWFLRWNQENKSSCPASEKLEWPGLSGAVQGYLTAHGGGEVKRSAPLSTGTCCGGRRWPNLAPDSPVCVHDVFSLATITHLKNFQVYLVLHFGSFIQYPSKASVLKKKHTSASKCLSKALEESPICATALLGHRGKEEKATGEEGGFRPWSLLRRSSYF